MSNLIYKGIVEDIRNDKCSDSEIEQLLEVFTRAISYFASDLSEKHVKDIMEMYIPVAYKVLILMGVGVLVRQEVKLPFFELWL